MTSCLHIATSWRVVCSRSRATEHAKYIAVEYQILLNDGDRKYSLTVSHAAGAKSAINECVVNSRECRQEVQILPRDPRDAVSLFNANISCQS